jgi:superfamily II DNA or RNA helicase
VFGKFSIRIERFKFPLKKWSIKKDKIMIELRDYQKEAVEIIIKKFGEGACRLLMHLPTGTGKTVVFCEILKRIHRPTLLLAHREELISQAVDKLLTIYPDADYGVVKAKQNELEHQITVASVQTLARPKRLEQIRADIGLIITDECHHAAAISYKRIYHRFGLYTADDEKKQKDFILSPVESDDVYHLGVTATPERNDRFGLLPIYDEIAYQRRFVDFVREGYLCDLEIKGIDTSLDLSAVKTTRLGGYGLDFQTASLSEAVNTDEISDDILQSYLKYASDRTRTLVFCVNREHAKRLYDQFLDSDIPCGYVDGETPADERKQTLADFESGTIRVLFNIMVLTEGYDCPQIDCILLARPTKSPSLLTQIIGRGTRTADGKANCLILDVAHSHRGGGRLIDIASLFYPPEVLEEDRPEGNRVLGIGEGDEYEDESEYKHFTQEEQYSVESILALLAVYSERRKKPWENEEASSKQKKYVRSLMRQSGNLLSLENQIKISDLTKGEVHVLIDELNQEALRPSGDNACPECGEWKHAKYELCYPCHIKTLDEDNICPECGEWKDEVYDLCYQCYQESQLF